MMVRAPVPGAVKTRLARALGPAGAATLYRAFIEDLCASLHRRFALVLACTPSRSDPFFARLARRYRVALVSQERGDLGARMRAAAGAALERAARVVVIGSDSPTLAPARVREAFRALRRKRVVLGPSLDGGYYLLGVRAPLPNVFARMPWGTERVLDLTLKRLRTASLTPALLPCWYDVDTPADLTLLRRHLAVMTELGERCCPRTRRALARLAGS